MYTWIHLFRNEGKTIFQDKMWIKTEKLLQRYVTIYIYIYNKITTEIINIKAKYKFKEYDKDRY